MESLKILPVKELKEETSKSRTKKKIPDILPQKHFLWIICAPVRSGKTNLITNLLYNDEIDYSEHFEDIIFISPTIENDKTGRFIMKDEHIHKIMEDLENLDLILQSIVEIQKQRLRDGEKSDTLIILDDCLGLLGYHNSYFSTLCSKYRHFRLSMMITTQSWKHIPNIARYNATAYVIMKTHNNKQYVAMEEELSGNFPNFNDIYKEATDERYSFLYLDMEKIKAYKRFEQLIWSKD
ncbi:MAG: ATPase/DNA packaging protein [Verrucomicrobiales bacterium]|nr:ATPase/DNA packaging protein [Verrucomicrobiales bacterium]